MGRDYFIKDEDLKLVANRKIGRPRKAQGGDVVKGRAKDTKA
jgi:hypothetical protein